MRVYNIGTCKLGGEKFADVGAAGVMGLDRLSVKLLIWFLFGKEEIRVVKFRE